MRYLSARVGPVGRCTTLRVHLTAVEERRMIENHLHELIELRRFGRSASGSDISILYIHSGLDGSFCSLFGTALGSTTPTSSTLNHSYLGNDDD